MEIEQARIEEEQRRLEERIAEEARKEMISALTYPSIVFIFTLAVVTFVMMYVVPKFVDIYNSMDSSQIPKFTLTVINISHFLEKNIILETL